MNKKVSFNKNKTEQKMENPTNSFSEMNLVVQSFKNQELKMKMWWVEVHK